MRSPTTSSRSRPSPAGPARLVRADEAEAGGADGVRTAQGALRSAGHPRRAAVPSAGGAALDRVRRSQGAAGMVQYFSGDLGSAIVTFKTALPTPADVGRPLPTGSGGAGCDSVGFSSRETPSARRLTPTAVHGCSRPVSVWRSTSWRTIRPPFRRSTRWRASRGARAQCAGAGGAREALARSLCEVGRYGEAAVEFERAWSGAAGPSGAADRARVGYFKGWAGRAMREAFQRVALAPGSPEATRGLWLSSPGNRRDRRRFNGSIRRGTSYPSPG